MPSYLVTWQIDVEAETPELAAVLARRAQTRMATIANVFDVQNVTKGGRFETTLVDLDQLDPWPGSPDDMVCRNCGSSCLQYEGWLYVNSDAPASENENQRTYYCQSCDAHRSIEDECTTREDYDAERAAEGAGEVAR